MGVDEGGRAHSEIVAQLVGVSSPVRPGSGWPLPAAGTPLYGRVLVVTLRRTGIKAMG